MYTVKLPPLKYSEKYGNHSLDLGRIRIIFGLDATWEILLLFTSINYLEFQYSAASSYITLLNVGHSPQGKCLQN